MTDEESACGRATIEAMADRVRIGDLAGVTCACCLEPMVIVNIIGNLPVAECVNWRCAPGSDWGGVRDARPRPRDVYGPLRTPPTITPN